MILFDQNWPEFYWNSKSFPFPSILLIFREDNEQLLTQYEREKQLRREAEEKYLEAEDSSDGEKVKLQDKMETMESLIRMLELKNKNFTEQVSRMEEKDSDVQKEFKKLHDRYTVRRESQWEFWRDYESSKDGGREMVLFNRIYSSKLFKKISKHIRFHSSYFFFRRFVVHSA